MQKCLLVQIKWKQKNLQNNKQINVFFRKGLDKEKGKFDYCSSIETGVQQPKHLYTQTLSQFYPQFSLILTLTSSIFHSEGLEKLCCLVYVEAKWETVEKTKRMLHLNMVIKAEKNKRKFPKIS